MFLVNSRSHLVIATSPGSRSKFLHPNWRTFSQSYGAILPSSFTRVLSSALGFSPCLPVSVCGTVLYHLKLRGFSWKHGINYFVSITETRHQVSELYLRIFQEILPTLLNRDNQCPDNLAFSVPPSQCYKVQEC